MAPASWAGAVLCACTRELELNGHHHRRKGCWFCFELQLIHREAGSTHGASPGSWSALHSCHLLFLANVSLKWTKSLTAHLRRPTRKKRPKKPACFNMATFHTSTSPLESWMGNHLSVLSSCDQLTPVVDCAITYFPERKRALRWRNAAQDSEACFHSDFFFLSFTFICIHILYFKFDQSQQFRYTVSNLRN